MYTTRDHTFMICAYGNSLDSEECIRSIVNQRILTETRSLEMSHVLAKQYAMGQNLPKVKVVTSVFNGEKYIQEQINSVLQQTYPNIELYIRDNCSTDRTLEILSYPPPPPIIGYILLKVRKILDL